MTLSCMSNSRFVLPKDASFIWVLSYVVLSFFQKLFYRIQVEGVQNIPVKGPVVFASNHTSGHDIIIPGLHQHSTDSLHGQAGTV